MSQSMKQYRIIVEVLDREKPADGESPGEWERVARFASGNVPIEAPDLLNALDPLEYALGDHLMKLRQQAAAADQPVRPIAEVNE